MRKLRGHHPDDRLRDSSRSMTVAAVTNAAVLVGLGCLASCGFTGSATRTVFPELPLEPLECTSLETTLPPWAGTRLVMIPGGKRAFAGNLTALLDQPSEPQKTPTNKALAAHPSGGWIVAQTVHPGDLRLDFVRHDGQLIGSLPWTAGKTRVVFDRSGKRALIWSSGQVLLLDLDRGRVLALGRQRELEAANGAAFSPAADRVAAWLPASNELVIIVPSTGQVVRRRPYEQKSSMQQLLDSRLWWLDDGRIIVGRFHRQLEVDSRDLRQISAREETFLLDSPARAAGSWVGSRAVEDHNSRDVYVALFKAGSPRPTRLFKVNSEHSLSGAMVDPANQRLLFNIMARGEKRARYLDCSAALSGLPRRGPKVMAWGRAIASVKALTSQWEALLPAATKLVAAAVARSRPAPVAPPKKAAPSAPRDKWLPTVARADRPHDAVKFGMAANSLTFPTAGFKLKRGQRYKLKLRLHDCDERLKATHHFYRHPKLMAGMVVKRPRDNRLGFALNTHLVCRLGQQRRTIMAPLRRRPVRGRHTLQVLVSPSANISAVGPYELMLDYIAYYALVDPATGAVLEAGQVSSTARKRATTRTHPEVLYKWHLKHSRLLARRLGRALLFSRKALEKGKPIKRVIRVVK